MQRSLIEIELKILRGLYDMTLPNYFNSTHPDTIFVQKLLVVKHNPDGRSILLDNQLKRYVKSRVEVTEINREDIPAILKSEFSIDYPAI